MLHADADFSVAVESSVETHNVGGVTLVQHLQLPNDLVPDGWFDFQVDQLANGRVCLHSHFMNTLKSYNKFSIFCICYGGLEGWGVGVLCLPSSP